MGLEMRRLIHKLKQRKGASLVEVMVAAGVMVIVFAGLLQVFLYSTILSDMSGNIIAATANAQDILEEMKAHDFDSIVTDYGASGTPGDTFTAWASNGTGQITITALEPDLLQIDIVVSWTERSTRAMSESLTGLIAKRN